MEIELMERELTGKIIGAAIEVHRYWGPGLYEEIYEKSLCRELTLQGLRFQRQAKLPQLSLPPTGAVRLSLLSLRRRH